MPADHIRMQMHFDEDIQISRFRKFLPEGQGRLYTHAPKGWIDD